MLNFEPSCGNACFRGILQNSALAGDNGTNTAYFDRI